LAAADYDVARAEYGIICLDEVDKLAANRSTNGRDVGGEGVQQALLKIIEGTTLQITAKHENKGNPRTPNPPTFNNNMSSQPPQKPETYTIRTDNILFIFTGAFVGLQKMVMDRVAKTSGSIGFGADVRPPMTLNHQMTLSDTDAHVYYKHLPFYADRASAALTDAEPYNPLDLATPTDLQTYGLIPEFLGRIPIMTALAPLSINSLLRVLTEPRNSIVAQYIHSFATFNADLRFTTPALYAIAETAFKLGTGARGVRTAVEALLGEAMYEVPGSSVRYVLVTRKSALREERVSYFSRGQGPLFRKEAEREEAEWDVGKVLENVVGEEQGEIASFEEFRERAGSGM
jgi:ATP-dependent Clp protease ATP-binding subunit ClpX